jgi:hypothetical protein
MISRNAVRRDSLILINTQLELGESRRQVLFNRFNGFLTQKGKPLKRIQLIAASAHLTKSEVLMRACLKSLLAAAKFDFKTITAVFA